MRRGAGEITGSAGLLLLRSLVRPRQNFVSGFQEVMYVAGRTSSLRRLRVPCELESLARRQADLDPIRIAVPDQGGRFCTRGDLVRRPTGKLRFPPAVG